MHGSLAPGRPRLNFAVGQACVGAYAAFDYRKLRTAHHGHHRSPGGPDDPDFHAARPDAFWPWFLRFFTTYFGWRELAVLTAVFWIWLLAFRAAPLNLALFWGLPSIPSALQLFTFGTWLPHRHAAAAPSFADHHNARTLPMPWIASLATCFHFGLHHEHHLAPSAPWWRLPRVRRDLLRPRVHSAGRGGGARPRSSAWVQIAIRKPRPNSHSFIGLPTETRRTHTPGPRRATLRPISR